MEAGLNLLIEPSVLLNVLSTAVASVVARPCSEEVRLAVRFLVAKSIIEVVEELVSSADELSSARSSIVSLDISTITPPTPRDYSLLSPESYQYLAGIPSMLKTLRNLVDDHFDTLHRRFVGVMTNELRHFANSTTHSSNPTACTTEEGDRAQRLRKETDVYRMPSSCLPSFIAEAIPSVVSALGAMEASAPADYILIAGLLTFGNQPSVANAAFFSGLVAGLLENNLSPRHAIDNGSVQIIQSAADGEFPATDWLLETFNQNLEPALINILLDRMFYKFPTATVLTVVDRISTQYGGKEENVRERIGLFMLRLFEHSQQIESAASPNDVYEPVRSLTTATSANDGSSVSSLMHGDISIGEDSSFLIPLEVRRPLAALASRNPMACVLHAATTRWCGKYAIPRLASLLLRASGCDSPLSKTGIASPISMLCTGRKGTTDTKSCSCASCCTVDGLFDLHSVPISNLSPVKKLLSAATHCAASWAYCDHGCNEARGKETRRAAARISDSHGLLLKVWGTVKLPNSIVKNDDDDDDDDENVLILHATSEESQRGELELTPNHFPTNASNASIDQVRTRRPTTADPFGTSTSTEDATVRKTKEKGRIETITSNARDVVLPVTYNGASIGVVFKRGGMHGERHPTSRDPCHAYTLTPMPLFLLEEQGTTTTTEGGGVIPIVDDGAAYFLNGGDEGLLNLVARCSILPHIEVPIEIPRLEAVHFHLAPREEEEGMREGSARPSDDDEAGGSSAAGGTNKLHKQQQQRSSYHAERRPSRSETMSVVDSYEHDDDTNAEVVGIVNNEIRKDAGPTKKTENIPRRVSIVQSSTPAGDDHSHKNLSVRIKSLQLKKISSVGTSSSPEPQNSESDHQQNDGLVSSQYVTPRQLVDTPRNQSPSWAGGLLEPHVANNAVAVLAGADPSDPASIQRSYTSFNKVYLGLGSGKVSSASPLQLTALRDMASQQSQQQQHDALNGNHNFVREVFETSSSQSVTPRAQSGSSPRLDTGGKESSTLALAGPLLDIPPTYGPPTQVQYASYQKELTATSSLLAGVAVGLYKLKRVFTERHPFAAFQEDLKTQEGFAWEYLASALPTPTEGLFLQNVDMNDTFGTAWAGGCVGSQPFAEYLETEFIPSLAGKSADMDLPVNDGDEYNDDTLAHDPPDHGQQETPRYSSKAIATATEEEEASVSPAVSARSNMSSTALSATSTTTMTALAGGTSSSARWGAAGAVIYNDRGVRMTTAEAMWAKKRERLEALAQQKQMKQNEKLMLRNLSKHLEEAAHLNGKGIDKVTHEEAHQSPASHYPLAPATLANSVAAHEADDGLLFQRADTPNPFELLQKLQTLHTSVGESEPSGVNTDNNDLTRPNAEDKNVERSYEDTPCLSRRATLDDKTSSLSRADRLMSSNSSTTSAASSHSTTTMSHALAENAHSTGNTTARQRVERDDEPAAQRPLTSEKDETTHSCVRSAPSTDTLNSQLNNDQGGSSRASSSHASTFSRGGPSVSLEATLNNANSSTAQQLPLVITPPSHDAQREVKKTSDGYNDGHEQEDKKEAGEMPIFRSRGVVTNEYEYRAPASAQMRMRDDTQAQTSGGTSRDDREDTADFEGSATPLPLNVERRPTLTGSSSGLSSLVERGERNGSPQKEAAHAQKSARTCTDGLPSSNSASVRDHHHIISLNASQIIARSTNSSPIIAPTTHHHAKENEQGRSTAPHSPQTRPQAQCTGTPAPESHVPSTHTSNRPAATARLSIGVGSLVNDALLRTVPSGGSLLPVVGGLAPINRCQSYTTTSALISSSMLILGGPNDAGGGNTAPAAHHRNASRGVVAGNLAQFSDVAKSPISSPSMTVGHVPSPVNSVVVTPCGIELFQAFPETKVAVKDLIEALLNTVLANNKNSTSRRSVSSGVGGGGSAALVSMSLSSPLLADATIHATQTSWHHHQEQQNQSLWKSSEEENLFSRLLLRGLDPSSAYMNNSSDEDDRRGLTTDLQRTLICPDSPTALAAHHFATVAVEDKVLAVLRVWLLCRLKEAWEKSGRRENYGQIALPRAAAERQMGRDKLPLLEKYAADANTYPPRKETFVGGPSDVFTASGVANTSLLLHSITSRRSDKFAVTRRTNMKSSRPNTVAEKTFYSSASASSARTTAGLTSQNPQERFQKMLTSVVAFLATVGSTPQTQTSEKGTTSSVIINEVDRELAKTLSDSLLRVASAPTAMMRSSVGSPTAIAFPPSRSAIPIPALAPVLAVPCDALPMVVRNAIGADEKRPVSAQQPNIPTILDPTLSLTADEGFSPSRFLPYSSVAGSHAQLMGSFVSKAAVNASALLCPQDALQMKYQRLSAVIYATHQQITEFPIEWLGDDKSTTSGAHKLERKDETERNNGDAIEAKSSATPPIDPKSPSAHRRDDLNPRIVPFTIPVSSKTAGSLAGPSSAPRTLLTVAEAIERYVDPSQRALLSTFITIAPPMQHGEEKRHASGTTASGATSENKDGFSATKGGEIKNSFVFRRNPAENEMECKSSNPFETALRDWAFRVQLPRNSQPIHDRVQARDKWQQSTTVHVVTSSNHALANYEQERTREYRTDDSYTTLPSRETALETANNATKRSDLSATAHTIMTQSSNLSSALAFSSVLLPPSAALNQTVAASARRSLPSDPVANTSTTSIPLMLSTTEVTLSSISPSTTTKIRIPTTTVKPNIVNPNRISSGNSDFTSKGIPKSSSGHSAAVDDCGEDLIAYIRTNVQFATAEKLLQWLEFVVSLLAPPAAAAVQSRSQALTSSLASPSFSTPPFSRHYQMASDVAEFVGQTAGMLRLVKASAAALGQQSKGNTTNKRNPEKVEAQNTEPLPVVALGPTHHYQFVNQSQQQPQYQPQGAVLPHSLRRLSESDRTTRVYSANAPAAASASASSHSHSTPPPLSFVTYVPIRLYDQHFAEGSMYDLVRSFGMLKKGIASTLQLNSSEKNRKKMEVDENSRQDEKSHGRGSTKRLLMSSLVTADRESPTLVRIIKLIEMQIRCIAQGIYNEAVSIAVDLLNLPGTLHDWLGQEDDEQKETSRSESSCGMNNRNFYGDGRTADCVIGVDPKAMAKKLAGFDRTVTSLRGNLLDAWRCEALDNARQAEREKTLRAAVAATEDLALVVAGAHPGDTDQREDTEVEASIHQTIRDSLALRRTLFEVTIKRPLRTKNHPASATDHEAEGNSQEKITNWYNKKVEEEIAQERRRRVIREPIESTQRRVKWKVIAQLLEEADDEAQKIASSRNTNNITTAFLTRSAQRQETVEAALLHDSSANTWRGLEKKSSFSEANSKDNSFASSAFPRSSAPALHLLSSSIPPLARPAVVKLLAIFCDHKRKMQQQHINYGRFAAATAAPLRRRLLHLSTRSDHELREGFDLNNTAATPTAGSRSSALSSSFTPQASFDILSTDSLPAPSPAVLTACKQRTDALLSLWSVNVRSLRRRLDACVRELEANGYISDMNRKFGDASYSAHSSEGTHQVHVDDIIMLLRRAVEI